MAYEYFKQRKPGLTKESLKMRGTEVLLEENAQYIFRNGKLEKVSAPKKPAKPMEPPKLTAGGFYKSNDGRKIQINIINKDYPEYPVVGIIQTDKGWEPRVWNESGVTKRPYGAVNDIIAKWSEG